MSDNTSFTYRYISKHTGASSAGWFPNIIKGRINLTSSYLMKLASLLKMNSSEAEYFEILVNYNQASQIDEKNFYFSKLAAMRGIKPALIQGEHLAFFSKWYISVIRELLFIHDFKDNYDELGNLIIPKISGDDAAEAINILKSIFFVRETVNGQLKPSQPIIKKDPTIKTDLWASHMKSKIKLGLQAIDQFSKEERDVSEVYMPLSKAGFEFAKNEIAKLRKKLLVIAENDTDQDRVYQCTLQLFPLTERVAQKKKSPE
jgi:uncharacterized protein (TIGR02147 family)